MSDTKKKKNHDVEEHEEHIDERWLVSYADMMTLLFGLFVILFSIASEKQGNFNENLKSVSDAATKLADNQVPPVVEEKKEEEKKPEEDVEALKKKLKDTEELVQTLKVKSDQLQEQFTEKQQKATEDLNMIDQLKKQIQDYKENIAKNENEMKLNKESNEKLLQLVQKNQQDKNVQNSVLQETVTLKQNNMKLTQNIDELNQKIKNLEKSLAAQPDKKQIERKISSLQEEDQKNQKTVEEKEKQIKMLNEKIAQIEETNSKLKKDLQENESKNADNKTYLFVLFKWSTEKHDLDLTVTDPKGHLFSFKKKSYPGSNGLFALDSRSGPGAEIWQSSDPYPGQYVVKVKMYNNYGNTEPAQLTGSILSNKSSIAIADKKIDSKGGSEQTFTFEVDAKGFIKML